MMMMMMMIVMMMMVIVAAMVMVAVPKASFQGPELWECVSPVKDGQDIGVYIRKRCQEFWLV